VGVTVAQTIETKLRAAFEPQRLAIVDESHLHAGHAGARPEGETHFRIEVVSAKFAGKSRVDRQRMVNKVLQEELAGSVHALAMRTLAPDEDPAQS
jgi:BolA protein